MDITNRDDITTRTALARASAGHLNSSWAALNENHGNPKQKKAFYAMEGMGSRKDGLSSALGARTGCFAAMDIKQ